MLTPRGWAALATGVGLWVAARLLGSRDLHMVAAGVSALPFLGMAFVRWTHPRLTIHRQLSLARATLGSRVTVTLTVENRGAMTTSFLLMEDALPPALGRSARLVVAGIPSRGEQKVSYTIACRQRGRYRIGPLSIHQTDPFGLAKTMVQGGPEGELVVYPEVEDIDARGLVAQGAGSGEAATRRMHRSAAEFYTMREYVTGDDLRRIHWPSVARTGQLMIRQDESTRRSSALLFLDTRSDALGVHGSAGFERAVSVTASLGRALSRTGFSLRLGSVDASPTAVSEENLLETLAGIGPSRTKSLLSALTDLRATALGDTTLAFVTAPPEASEVAALSRLGVRFGRRIIVLVYPAVMAALPPAGAGELEGRAAAARASLVRAGWDVYLVHPDGKLADVWRRTKTRKLRVAASRS